ncbi:MAG: ATP-binding protein, partial [Proteobacteria bacterium]|nr:ATP-binding protein [Pseudomonadota bacterium]
MSFWNRPNTIRRFLRCPPSVVGFSEYGLGRSLLKQSLTYGKRATRRCRCGYLDDPAQGCGRAPKCALEYQSKISGPLFDRIDLHVDVPAVKPADLSLP